MWWLPVVLRILVAHLALPWTLKLIVGKHSRTLRFFLQFLFCAILATLLAVYLGELRPTPGFWLLMVVGFANGFAAYWQWRAMDISLSKTSLFTFWDDIIAMTLAAVILGETKVLNPVMGLGIFLSLLSVILFALHAYREKKKGGTARTPPSFLFYVGGYSVIWGVATFFQRYWALKEVPTGQFLLGWYGGATIAATGLLLFYRDKSASQAGGEKFTMRDTLGMFVRSLLIMVSLGLGYWAYRTPQVVVQPIFLVSEMILPALVGLYIFHERKKQFDRAEWVYLAIGFAGGLTVALSYS